MGFTHPTGLSNRLLADRLRRNLTRWFRRGLARTASAAAPQGRAKQQADCTGGERQSVPSHEHRGFLVVWAGRGDRVDRGTGQETLPGELGLRRRLESSLEDGETARGPRAVGPEARTEIERMTGSPPCRSWRNSPVSFIPVERSISSDRTAKWSSAARTTVYSRQGVTDGVRSSSRTRTKRRSSSTNGVSSTTAMVSGSSRSRSPLATVRRPPAMSVNNSLADLREDSPVRRSGVIPRDSRISQASAAVLRRATNEPPRVGEINRLAFVRPERAGCTIRRSVGIRFARRTRSFSRSVSYSLFERGSSCRTSRAGWRRRSASGT